MANKIFSQSNTPVRKTEELLPKIFQTGSNKKFFSGVVDPLVQPGVLEKSTGFFGRRYGKTYNGNDVYLDEYPTLRSKYQLEPGVVIRNDDESISSFYDYIDFKNQIKFFNNDIENDRLITEQEHYSWDPPIDWDKFVNFREYYWVPSSLPVIEVSGRQQKIESSYKVKLGPTPQTYVFFPDGATNNPIITLYRGQTYKFQINAPKDGFVIRSTYSIDNLQFDPTRYYAVGSLVLFDNNFWRALRDIPIGDGSTIDRNSEDWVYVEPETVNGALDYNEGIDNNGIENGTITFTVPYTAPDVLYYQSKINPERLGRFIVADVDSNTFLDVDKELLGKQTFKSANNVEFTNGLAIKFSGKIYPESYGNDEIFIVEGVGDAITLTKFSDLLVGAGLNTDVPEVLFDNGGFDIDPFDDASYFPGKKDYVTIRRDSRDLNAWSRYNRWFHRSVLEYAYRANGSEFDLDESLRAKRPIIEFKPNIELFSHGTQAKLSVDFIDDFTKDIFSIIEGSNGYIIDGEEIFEGARVLFTADTDSLANNRIYKVKFITHNGRRQITLVKVSDSESTVGDCVLVKRGKKYKRIMFHFNGSKWKESQSKISVNQSPKFNIFDEDGVSFSNIEKYPTSTFLGSNILSYRQGSSVIDSELGFSLSYLNIDNIGDIEFNFDYETDSFTFQSGVNLLTKYTKTGYLRNSLTEEVMNCWVSTDNKFLQPILDSIKVEEDTNELIFKSVNWNDFKEETETSIRVYINNIETSLYQRSYSKFTFENTLKKNDIVSLKIFCKTPPDEGWYEFPAGLEKNPFNEDLQTITYGTAVDHLKSSIEFVDLLGNTPGVSNLRDVVDYQKFGYRILKHSSFAPISLNLLCDKNINIIKSIEYNSQKYLEFRTTFLELAKTINYNSDIVQFVDDIFDEYSKSKNQNSTFFESDMCGTGAYNTIEYEVEDEGTKTFALSQAFDLTTTSDRAVYVYVNNQQLINGKDYVFDSVFGFVRLLLDLFEGDKISIKEYQTSANCFIPSTPTKLGLFPKYFPKKFIDNTFITPREVIQGHDGSIIFAFGDFRDDLILELEKRIYNNIKKYFEFESIDQYISSRFSNNNYTKTTFDQIISRDFLHWLSDTDLDYINNVYFDSENSFTYTYSRMTDKNETTSLPGYWRGVYRWYYDTDRPHICPWEILGFSEMPTWWEEEYGPAPYTRGNLILWEDIRDGIIRQGSQAGTYDRYARPTILDHIPVDDDGNLLSPLDSGLAYNFSLINNKNPFVFGDVGPVEHAWRSSSQYPFSVLKALCLLKPFDYISKNFNTERLAKNLLGHSYSKVNGYFLEKSDISSFYTGTKSGLVLYIIDYLKSQSYSVSSIYDSIENMETHISVRASGFIDKENQKYILDSKNPKSTSGSVFVPPENYAIIFNVSSPIKTISYSGIIIEKSNLGWKITGYDKIRGYFNYFPTVASNRDPTISVGGISENFIDWQEEKFYGNGIIVRYQNKFYRSLKSHTSGLTFESNLWQPLSKLPLTGAVEAYKRQNFNKLKVSKLEYGTVLENIQLVVDFFLGYQEYLKDQGMTFDGYDSKTSTSHDWLTSAKEFMFWTKQNWSEGSLLTLSPCAYKIDVKLDLGVAESLLDGFYEYSVLKSDGKKLDLSYIDVYRDYQHISVTSNNEVDGIYFINLIIVLKENVTVFDNRTVFNDVIYDPTTGYRQERIKARGFRTTDWDGDYTSPGFLFDNVNIQEWKPFTDYKLGDIVNYKSYNWTSLINQFGTETFSDATWSKLDSDPTKELIPNYDFRINQFEDYYNLDAAGVGSSQRDLGRHAIGYQSRSYLENLAEDEIIQFKLYQGFIREKGTANAVVKVFDKTSTISDDSIVISEEWAFLVGQLGGQSQITEVEFQIKKDDIKITSQPVQLIDPVVSDANSGQILRIGRSQFTISNFGTSNVVFEKSKFSDLNRSAGYVKLDQIDYVVDTLENLSLLDINQLRENDHIWVTFKNSVDWSVLRFNRANRIKSDVDGVVRTGNSSVMIKFNTAHTIDVDDYIGLKNINNLTGFYKVVSVATRSLTISIDPDSDDPEFESSTFNHIYKLSEARIKDSDNINFQEISSLDSGSRIWIDKNTDDNWEVLEKQYNFEYRSITDYGNIFAERSGQTVVMSDVLKQYLTSIPNVSQVVYYRKGSTDLTYQGTVLPPDELLSLTNFSFGKSIAISPDGKWLAVGCPNATGIKTRFLGNYDPNADYDVGDIVLNEGKLWKAIDSIRGDGSSLDVFSERWTPATVLDHQPTLGYDEGITNQGCVVLYYWQANQWNYSTTIASPNFTYTTSILEEFGSSIKIGVVGTTYYMAVSAPGSYDNRGRVYLLINSGTGWTYHADTSYYGKYISSRFYPKGSIVWYDGKLYQAQVEIIGDSSSISTEEGTDWVEIDDISTEFSLPINVFVDDDGLSLNSGSLNSTDVSALVKSGDRFGHSIAMNRDGSILVIGAPYSDGQWFANFRGDYRTFQEYFQDDVVRYNNIYYKLLATFLQGVDPSDTDQWQEIGDSTDIPTGKVFIYTRDSNNRYKLTQTITSGSLAAINDISEEFISSGDRFGHSIDIDYTGTTIVASSPAADLNFENQGSVYIFRTSSVSATEFRLIQKLESYGITGNEEFGTSVSITPLTETIAVGGINASFIPTTTFDVSSTTSTTFDKRTTGFVESSKFSGQVYVYQLVSDKYILSAKLEADLQEFESFGSSIDTTSSEILVGSSNYRVGSTAKGLVRLFSKLNGQSSWKTLSEEEDQVDISKISTISIYDDISKTKTTELDFVDHYKNKILGIAEQEIDYKTLYDPAVYSTGTDEQVVDASTSWKEKYVGKVWWNLSTAKWIDYEQGDIDYRTGNWNMLAEGATIDVYEWVESKLLPSEWAIIADTVEGLSEGISGQPLHSDDTVYSEKSIFNINTGLLTETLYYYWVKGKNVIPSVPTRRRTVTEVATLITDPISSGLPIVSFLNSNQLLLSNVKNQLSDKSLFNIEFKKRENVIPVHKEYQLLSDGDTTSPIANSLERKWIDSLIGFDEIGNPVPDINLPTRQRYGINFRPRQSMFVDREKILKIVVDNINSTLYSRAFCDYIGFDNLLSADPVPSFNLNFYDISIESYDLLQFVGTARITNAVLEPIFVNGKLQSISIIESGFGYRVPPPVVIIGTGNGATASVTLDNQGRVVSTTVLTAGKNYSSGSIRLRQFSVLVENDETSNGLWSIYAWDDQRDIFYRTKTQGYKTSNYWKKIDWWASEFNEKSKIKIELLGMYQLDDTPVSVGDLIKIKEYGTGGWAVIERVEDSTGNLSLDFNLVGRENGTIELLESLYNSQLFSLGFDNISSFDTSIYDNQPVKELRKILDIVKNEIFLEDLRIEWNKLFFKSIKYAFSEQENIDWAFKTSFVNAMHNVGSFNQRPSYKNDNLESYKEYLEEIKPYRTTIREYVSRYTSTETYSSSSTDFDLPPWYSNVDGKIVPITSNNEVVNQYPWKWWLENNSFSITSIEISNRGSGYTVPPTVLIEGTGTGCTARAYISNGSVTSIRVEEPGSGYIGIPAVKLVGGNGSNQDRATAVAILGNSKVRTLNLSLKFDRISKTGIVNSYTQSQTFVSNGNSAVFDLSHAPIRDKSKISILKNRQLVLGSEYTISLYRSSVDTYSLLKGKIIFNQAPEKDDVIEIIYEKNDELLDSVDRIEKYYSPTVGMKGNEVSQLMTGVDFGGVQIQGTTFDITGGWDALPWFTDSWDSVEPNGDFYYFVDSDESPDSSQIYKTGSVIKFNNKLYIAIRDTVTSTGTVVLPETDDAPLFWTLFYVTLPYIPTAGQQVTIYIKRRSDNPYLGLSVDSTLERKIDNLQYTDVPKGTRYIRIDDPNYTSYTGDTMPTFVGDGSTASVQFYDESESLYVAINSGDILVFRLTDSDGSVIISDNNLIDTDITGGTLSSVNGAYITAQGINAEDITVDGETFISPDQVPAPEENIPGQVLDSLSIKVFNTSNSGAAPLLTHSIVGDGNTKVFPIGQTIAEPGSISVFLDKIKQTNDGSVPDYFIDFKDPGTIEFNSAPPIGSIVEIISLGIGGIEILDYQEFVSDNETLLYLTKAKYQQTRNVFVTIDGVETDANFLDSGDLLDEKDYTLIQLGNNPNLNSVIKILVLGNSTIEDVSDLSLVRINRQRFAYDGSTSTFTLDNFTNFSRGSVGPSTIVSVNDRILIGVDTTIVYYDGTNNEIVIGTDPQEFFGSITLNNISVYVNKELKRYITDYVFSGVENKVILTSSNLEVGDEIRIENNVRSQYSIENDVLSITNDYSMVENDVIDIIWFEEYPSMDMTSDEYSGGKMFYPVVRELLSLDYIWVYLNNVRLTQDVDYWIEKNYRVYLRENTSTDDDIKIIQFGSDIRKSPVAYEISKDMLNVFNFKRFSRKNNVTLARELKYYDKEIQITDTSMLFKPIPEKNIPGTILINGERIDYFEIDGNILRKIRRGTSGTSIGEIYEVGSYVVDVGRLESIPYKDEQDRQDFISDGSSLLIGPLSYIPKKSESNFYRDTQIINGVTTYLGIPLNYGKCDEIEIFVGGKRLRKDSISVFDENLAVSSPTADITQEAEFSVDGELPYVRLSSIVPAGTRITVIKRIGQTWYDRGENTATTGVTLLKNHTPMVRFINETDTELPE